ncbi:phage integrase SAM-like domain-containing protein [Hymenobacter sp. DG25B]|uniref:phage integrase SAM-like domain-containing protein n=1 Tax=Hymenobacter sp. DG25B TaxID=1385664 RepID=UPI000AE7C19A|nr:phage integrase SAM-like domain-containing protein [Hymenobacter sp. DG25B]
MSKISYLLRLTGKSSTEAAIYVKHTHRGSPFVKSTGAVVHPDYFNAETGRVISKLPQAPELNAAIEAVRAMMEIAARNLLGKGLEPLKENMADEYGKLLANQAAAQPSQESKCIASESELEKLHRELRELELLVEAKKKEVESYELRLGIYEGRLLSKFIFDYRKARESTLKPNSLRLFTNVAEWVTKFRSQWRIDEVNVKTLREFQNFLLAQGKQSQTVADLITKTKSVVYYYARTLRLDISELKDFRLDFKKKKTGNVVYLTKEELADLMALPIEKPTERVVRDQFVVMSLTGVRFSDSRLTKDNIVNGQIRVSTEKTDTDVFIPMAPKVREILEAHDYNFKYVPASNFNKYIKSICSRIPSIADRKELVKTYRGGKITKRYITKDQLISCHTGRKNFINLALAKGVNPVAIADIVGHEGTHLIMNTYGSSRAGRDAIASIW